MAEAPDAPAPGGDVRRRDEILQIMFWMRGEGLGNAPTPADLRRLLPPADGDRLDDDLAALRASGLVEDADGGGYRLTDAGREEGGRRFAEAFDGMTRQGHGACSDPLCDCHELGPEACAHAPSTA